MNSLMPMTRMIDAALNQSQARCAADTTWTTTPRADVLEGDQEYRILLDLPGIRSEDLELNLEQQTLTVKAERSLELPEGFTSRRSERSGKLAYARTFRLGNGVDTDEIKANLKDGVLEVTLPKSEQSLPRKIEVN
jgi:HSP20 family protein